MQEIRIESVPVGDIGANCYIVENPALGECVLVDPGAEAERIIRRVGKRTPKAVLLTHGHFDHIGAADEVCAHFGVPLYVHADDASKLKESSINEMDAVLLDAPCSGIGVLGNKPDAKYKYTKSKVDELGELQKNLLDTVCQYVRPGGALVYSTCTVLPEENEDQVRAFLERHPDFHLAAFDVPEAYASGLKDGMLTLHSHIHHCEGFFIARMERDE